MPSALLGAHVDVAAELCRRVDALRTGTQPASQVVVIEGASGTGKTAIVQELYRRLASSDPYWPDDIAAGSSTVASDPLAGRKLIAPELADFVWPKNALPTFGWWGFGCERLATGSYQDVVAAAKPQLDAHVLPLTLALGQARSVANKAGGLAVSMLREIRDLAAAEGRQFLIDAALDAAGLVAPFSETSSTGGSAASASWPNTPNSRRSCPRRRGCPTPSSKSVARAPTSWPKSSVA